MDITSFRKEYHSYICKHIVRLQGDKGDEYPNFADPLNKTSRAISWGITDLLGCSPGHELIDYQSIHHQFNQITLNFLKKSLRKLQNFHHRALTISSKISRGEFPGFDNLARLTEAYKTNREIANVFLSGYIVTPDIVIGRWPVADNKIDINELFIDNSIPVAKYTSIRKSKRPPSNKIFHASISCKWTIRNNHTYNTCTEAFNLIQNRKGPLPHVIAVTAEPTPHRLASLALGTGDLDCVYHFALYELLQAVQNLGLEDTQAEIQMMIDGKRLRDISDLPFDLAI